MRKNSNQSRSSAFVFHPKLGLAEQEKKDLVEFLKSL